MQALVGSHEPGRQEGRQPVQMAIVPPTKKTRTCTTGDEQKAAGGLALHGRQHIFSKHEMGGGAVSEDLVQLGQRLLRQGACTRGGAATAGLEARGEPWGGY